MPDITLFAFLSQQETARESVEALAKNGIIISYWTARRWRNKDSWPKSGMKKMLAKNGIKA